MLITPFFSSRRRDETPSKSQVRDFPRRRRATSLHLQSSILHPLWLRLPGSDEVGAIHDPPTQYYYSPNILLPRYYLGFAGRGAELALEIKTMRKSLIYALLRPVTPYYAIFFKKTARTDSPAGSPPPYPRRTGSAGTNPLA